MSSMGIQNKTNSDDLYDSEEQKGISVVVPVHNSEGTIAPLVQRTVNSLQKMACPYEIILVDDGSRDGSWRKIRNITSEYAEVKGIQLMKNFGQQNALLCGIRAGMYDLIVTMDDDCQHPPEEIPSLLKTMQEHDYDVVYGVPIELPHSWWRNLGSRAIKHILAKALRSENMKDMSAFLIFRTYLREAFGTFRGPHVSIDVLLSWGTSRFGATKVRHEPRLVGKTGYDLGKLFNYAMVIITGFSTTPLRFAGILGLVFAFFGLCMLVYVILVYFMTEQTVPGFPFLASAISIFSGVQLFSIGIVGEYLSKMYDRSMQRPAYSILSRTGNDNASFNTRQP